MKKVRRKQNKKTKNWKIGEGEEKKRKENQRTKPWDSKPQ